MLKIVLEAAAATDPRDRRALLSGLVASRLSDERVDLLLGIVEQWAHEDEAGVTPATAAVFELARASMGVWKPAGLRAKLLGGAYALCFSADGVCTWAGGAGLPDHEFRGLVPDECGELLGLPVAGLYDNAALDGSIVKGLPVGERLRAFSCPLDADRVLMVFDAV